MFLFDIKLMGGFPLSWVNTVFGFLCDVPNLCGLIIGETALF